MGFIIKENFHYEPIESVEKVIDTFLIKLGRVLYFPTRG